MKPLGIFVTGTDTGIGKTVLSATLVRRLGADYWKPVQSGLEDEPDTDAVRRLTGLPADHFHEPAYTLQAPLSPHESARREGRRIVLTDFNLPTSRRPVVVEGAGGVLVPMNENELMIDLMARLDLPIVLAARSGLGTINHTLLSLIALRDRGLDILGVVLCGEPDAANRAAIERYGKIRVLGELPPLSPLTPEAIVEAGKSIAVELPEREKDDIVELDQKHVWHPFTQAATAPRPIEIAAGRGSTLIAADGREYVDLAASWWVNIHGHAHPKVASAIARQARTIEQVLFADLTHAPAARLAAKLCDMLPEGLSRVFYSDNGSTAVESSLKISHQYWRNLGQHRNRFLAFKGGYHGDTVGAMSVGLSSGFYKGFEPMTFKVDFLPFPETWEGDDDPTAREEASLKALEAYLDEHPDEVASVLVEPLIQGSAGMRMCRPEFLRKLAERTKGRTLLIFDEVMTGFGRTGAMFACLKAGVTPDIICLAKGLTAGFLPMAAAVCREEIFSAFLGPTFDRAFAYGHSFTANPLGCAAGLASLEILKDEDALGHVAAIEALHRRRLAELARDPVVGGRMEKPRVTGCIGALTVKTQDPGYKASVGPRFKAFFMERGLYIRPMGDVVYMMPPFCTEPKDLERAWDAVAEALASL